jgi:hypothetical protein
MLCIIKYTDMLAWIVVLSTILLTGCTTHFTTASSNPGIRLVEWLLSGRDMIQTIIQNKEIL